MPKLPWKKKQTDSFYTFDNMVNRYPNAAYYVAFSERGNGKTYDILKRFLKHYCEHGWQGAYIRRFYEAYKASRGDALCNGLVRDGLVSKYSGGEWDNIYHAGNRWYLCKTEEKKKKDGSTETRRVISREPFMFAFALDQMENDKGASYDRVHEIAFDEFLTRSFYLQDEFILFNNVLSTLIRNKTDVKIFMAGNTVSKIACPYFREMGLTRVKKQEQGTIDIYNYGDTGLQVVVEYCANRKKSKENERYFAFGNPRLKMITSGEWEVAVHPHIKKGAKPRDILFTFFIYFDDELMQCQVVLQDGAPVLNVMQKTTPLKYPEKELIYSDQYEYRPNWRRSIIRDTLPVSARIRDYIHTGKVYFSDNATGEIFDAFLNWSKQNT